MAGEDGTVVDIVTPSVFILDSRVTGSDNDEPGAFWLADSTSKLRFKGNVGRETLTSS